jgi:hypothetical protein
MADLSLDLVDVQTQCLKEPLVAFGFAGAKLIGCVKSKWHLQRRLVPFGVQLTPPKIS